MGDKWNWQSRILGTRSCSLQTVQFSLCPKKHSLIHQIVTDCLWGARQDLVYSSYRTWLRRVVARKIITIIHLVELLLCAIYHHISLILKLRFFYILVNSETVTHFITGDLLQSQQVRQRTGLLVWLWTYLVTQLYISLGGLCLPLPQSTKS